MEYDELVRRQSTYPVDFIVGQITEVDNPTERPSRVGPPQLCQDLILEDDLGRQIVVQFYGLNKGCLTRKKSDRKEEINFEPAHRGYWVRLENKAKDESKATLKRVSGSAAASRHYKKKRGIVVVLKATATVKIQPLLDRDQEFPTVRRTRSDKKPRKRRVPGQEPQGDTVTNQRRPPQGRKQDQRREPADTTPAEPRQHPDASRIDRMTDVFVWCESAILLAYEKSKLPAPRPEWLEGPIVAIQIAVGNRMNLSGDEKNIKSAIWRLALLYISIHTTLARKYQANEKLQLPEGHEMFKRVTTTFIAITRDKSWNLG